MAPRFQPGQKVIINPASVTESSLRESELYNYIGQVGVVKDFYWLTLDRGINMFYVYTVHMERSNRELVLHEDELEEYRG